MSGRKENKLALKDGIGFEERQLRAFFPVCSSNCPNR